MPCDVTRHLFKPGLIVHALAAVAPDRLLIEVTEEMKRFDADIRSIDSVLEQRPEVFESIGMITTVNILDSMIDSPMSVFTAQNR